MKLYMLACLLAIASSAALESATPTKKAPTKVDPVPLSTANTASEATHSQATHSHHHQDKQSPSRAHERSTPSDRWAVLRPCGSFSW